MPFIVSGLYLTSLTSRLRIKSLLMEISLLTTGKLPPASYDNICFPGSAKYKFVSPLLSTIGKTKSSSQDPELKIDLLCSVFILVNIWKIFFFWLYVVVRTISGTSTPIRSEWKVFKTYNYMVFYYLPINTI